MVRLCPDCKQRPRAQEHTPAMDPARTWAAEFCSECYEAKGYKLVELSEGVSRWIAPRVVDPLPDELLFDPAHDLNGIRYSRYRWSR